MENIIALACAMKQASVLQAWRKQNDASRGWLQKASRMMRAEVGNVTAGAIVFTLGVLVLFLGCWTMVA